MRCNKQSRCLLDFWNPSNVINVYRLGFAILKYYVEYRQIANKNSIDNKLRTKQKKYDDLTPEFHETYEDLTLEFHETYDD